MNGRSHELASISALYVLRRLQGAPDLLQGLKDICSGSRMLDNMQDMEFVNVWGDMDDPHKDDPWYEAIDDDASRSAFGRDYTSYSHYIDIGKQTGIYDDFDGYAYNRGSAKLGDYQSASDLIYSGDTWDDIVAGACSPFAPDTFDAVISWYFGDYYAHAPGHEYYRDGKCSPALERYCWSEYRKHKEWNLEAECLDRFPQGKDGIPQSVFPPIDNVGAYWFLQYMSGYSPLRAGYLLHAVQDCAVPHHAGCHHGNWHTKYEDDLDVLMEKLYGDSAFLDEAYGLLKSWASQSSPINSIGPNDINLAPNIGWRVDHLMTWVALHAYGHYTATYKSFTAGYSKLDEDSAKELAKYAVAIGALILAKAHKWVPPVVPPAPKAQELSISPQYVRFDMAVQETKKVTLKNVGDFPLTIKAIYDSGDRHYSISSPLPPLPIVLSPGQNLEMEISMDRSIDIYNATPAIQSMFRLIARKSALDVAITERFQIARAALGSLGPQRNWITILSDCANSPTDYIFLTSGWVGSVPLQYPRKYPWDRLPWPEQLLDKQMERGMKAVRVILAPSTSAGQRTNAAINKDAKVINLPALATLMIKRR